MGMTSGPACGPGILIESGSVHRPKELVAKEGMSQGRGLSAGSALNHALSSSQEM